MQRKQGSVYLKNYAEFMEYSAAVAEAAGDKKTAILYADITGFQLINDYYGFLEGDRFLTSLGGFLLKLPGAKACARVFSDHFLVLIMFADNSDVNDLVRIYKRMFVDFLEQQFMFHPNCKVSIASGLCVMENTSGSLVKAIDNANLARKEAKGADHTSVILFHDQMREKVKKQKEMQLQIQTAFREKEFIFFLQPKVNLHTGKIIGAEALARWIKKDGSMVYPDDFIPTMEKDGTIVELDFLIYRQVCEYISDRMKDGKVLFPISVNMSRIHIGRWDFAEKIYQMAETYGIPPYLLEFELTETVLLDEFDVTKKVIDSLRDYGYKVSIDDFGTGFTGINVWKELDFDVVKLDKTFISDNVLEMQRNDTIIISITYVGKKMETALLCEGMETIDQCSHMRDLGIEIGQGYYFSPPVSAEVFDTMFEEKTGYFELPWAGDLQDGLAPEYLETEAISPTQMRSITHSLIHIMPCGMAGIEENSGKLLFLSDKVLEMFGYTREDFLNGKDENWMSKLFPLNFGEKKLQEYKDKFAVDGYFSFEYSAWNKQGEKIYLSTYGARVSTPEFGTYVLCCFFDNSGNKEMEKLSEQLNTVVENTPGDIVVITLLGEDFSMQFLTMGMTLMSGYSKEEFETMQEEHNELLLVAEEDRKEILKEALKVFKSKEQLNYNFRFRNKDGSVEWHNISANYSHETEDGEVIYHGIFTNVDYLKKQEEALKRSETRYRAAAEIAHTDLWSYDFHLKKLELPATEELSRLELAGKKVLSLEEFVREGHIHPDYLEAYFDIYKKIEEGSDYEETKLLAKTIEGTYEWFLLRCKVVAWSDTGSPLEMVSVSERIREMNV